MGHIALNLRIPCRFALVSVHLKVHISESLFAGFDRDDNALAHLSKPLLKFVLSGLDRFPSPPSPPQEPMITCILWFLTILPNAWLLEDVPFLSLPFSRTASGSPHLPRLAELCQLQPASLCFLVFSCPQISKLYRFYQLPR